MRKRYWFVLLIIVAFLVMDISLWFNQQVPISNRFYRIVSGAPAAHLNGHLLMYHGKDTSKDNEVVFYKNDDESEKLYKAKGIPDQQIPPYYFIRKSDGAYYKYAQPHSPFGMR